MVTLKILQSKTWPCLFPDLLQRQRTSFRPEFYTLQRYSPYDNLRMQDYPAEAWRHLESMLKACWQGSIWSFHLSPFVTTIIESYWIIVSVSPRPWWLRRRTTRWWATGSRWNMCPNSDASRRKLARRGSCSADLLSNKNVRRLDKNC